jgi:DNA helicase HerA-like ATPase
MYDQQGRALIALGQSKEICLLPAMANRHGLITGATGAGKTITLQTMAETFSQMGVPVLAADVKGDLAGIAAPGGRQKEVRQRVKDWHLQEKGFAFQSFPVRFWDVFAEQGLPVRAPLSSLGPLLLSRLLTLNETQSALLSVLFKIAQDQALALVDIKDLRELLRYASANSAALAARYGNISGVSLGAIQRNLLALEQEGGGLFFAEPALDLSDLLANEQGKGVINILAAGKLMNAPRLYTTLLLWLLHQLFVSLPETGDTDKPKLAFFFDEAHLLFHDPPKALLEKILQTVRLIRSKGVGVYFITQSPGDIPEAVLGQLGNRIQHALRSYTPKDQQSLRAAARSFRANPAFNTEQAISGLNIGEALVSFLDSKGAPLMVERAFIVPPQSRIGPLPAAEREAIINSSPLYARYAETEERLSAYEILTKREDARSGERKRAEKSTSAGKIQREEGKLPPARQRQAQRESAARRKFWGGVARSALLSLLRQFFRSLFKKR